MWEYTRRLPGRGNIPKDHRVLDKEWRSGSCRFQAEEGEGMKDLRQGSLHFSVPGCGVWKGRMKS